MPCYDPRSDAEVAEEERQQQLKLIQKVGQLHDGKKRAEAMLCAICNVLASKLEPRDPNDFTDNSVSRPNMLTAILREIVESEAGVTSAQIKSWYKRHKENDRQRTEALHKDAEAKRARKIAQDAEKALRKQALNKLSAKEKKVLGIK